MEPQSTIVGLRAFALVVRSLWSDLSNLVGGYVALNLGVAAAVGHAIGATRTFIDSWVALAATSSILQIASRVEQTVAWVAINRAITLPLLLLPLGAVLIATATRAVITLRSRLKDAATEARRVGATFAALQDSLRLASHKIKFRAAELIVTALDWVWTWLQEYPYLYQVDLIRRHAAHLWQEGQQRVAPFTTPAGATLRYLGLDVWSQRSAEIDLVAGKPDTAERPAVPAAIDAALRAIEPRAMAVPELWSAKIRQAIDRQLAGESAHVLLIGNAGVGKSTLIAHTREQWPHEVQYLVPPRGPDRRPNPEAPDHDALPHETASPAMVVVDPLEFWFLRTPGKFAPVRDLLIPLPKSGGRRFVVATCSPAFYSFARLLYPIDAFFDTRIDMNALDAATIVAIYDHKFATAGYHQRIVPGAATLKTIAAMKRRHAIADHEVGSTVKNLYYRDLIDRGGVSFPFINHYIIRSIAKIANRAVHLHEPRFPDISFVTELPLNLLFTIQALFIHRALNHAELANVLVCSMGEAQLFLGQVLEQGLAITHDGYYRIDAVVYRPLYELLRKKNLF